jgi:signal peptidase I
MRREADGVLLRLRLLARLLVLWLRHQLVVVTVDGTSMVPTLLPADRVLCARSSPIAVGSVVVRASVVGHERVYQIKRVTGLAGSEIHGRVLAVGYAWIEGDNRATSADSRQYGPVALAELIAVGMARLSPSGLVEL